MGTRFKFITGTIGTAFFLTLMLVWACGPNDFPTPVPINPTIAAESTQIAQLRLENERLKTTRYHWLSNWDNLDLFIERLGCTFSMVPEFDCHDGVIMLRFNPNKYELDTGMIARYKKDAPSGYQSDLFIHRIIDIKIDPDTLERTYLFKGDGLFEADDPWVREDQIDAVAIGVVYNLFPESLYEGHSTDWVAQTATAVAD